MKVLVDFTLYSIYGPVYLCLYRLLGYELRVD
jgi:hypothetical protein